VKKLIVLPRGVFRPETQPPNPDGLYFHAEIRHEWSEPGRDDEGKEIIEDRSLYIGHAIFRPNGDFVTITGPDEAAAEQVISKLNKGGKGAPLTMECKRLGR
jgi:hypothetical protein